MIITEPEVKQLRKAYNKAVAAKETEFEFNGKAFLVTYAKYLLEYLDDFFGRGKHTKKFLF